MDSSEKGNNIKSPLDSSPTDMGGQKNDSIGSGTGGAIPKDNKKESNKNCSQLKKEDK